MTLSEQLDGAKCVKYDPNLDATIAWFGGHGIHAYTPEGKEFAYWNIGDFANNAASFEEVQEEIDKQIASGDYLEYY